LCFNGSVPGPAIIADWGDEIIIHVTNNLEHNGTAIHVSPLLLFYDLDAESDDSAAENVSIKKKKNRW